MFARWANATLSIGLAAGVALGAPCPAVVAAAEPAYAPLAGAAARGGPVRQLSIAASKSTVLDFDEDLRDVLVSNPTVADAVVRTNRRLYIMGNKLGTTNIFVFGASGRQIAAYELQVQPDIATLQNLIRRLMPESDIHVEAVAGTVVLSGSVANSGEAMQAYEVAAKFIGAPIEQAGSSSGGSGGSGGASAGGGSSGRTTGESVQVVNALKIRGKEQVMLKVTIAEVQRNAVKKLGIDLTTAGRVGTDTTGLAGAVLNNSGAFTNILSQNGFPVTSGVDPALDAMGTYKIGNLTLNSRLQTLERLGVLRTLAEPNLSAISGEQAKFLVGGEYPIPVSQGTTGGAVQTTVEFKQYGVALNFIPVVLSEGRISLTVNTEVSELTSDGAAKVSSTLTIPALQVRRASTTLEIPSGGAMVLAGLLKDDTRQAISGTPGLMKLPILGALFRSRDFQRAESELAIFVQPFIVRPTSMSKLQRPDQNFQPATDAAGYFMGRVNRMYRVNGADNGTYRGQYGFIYE